MKKPEVENASSSKQQQQDSEQDLERKRLRKVTDRRKFAVSAWKLFSYTLSVSYGIWTLWGEPWAHAMEFLNDWPHYHMRFV